MAIRPVLLEWLAGQKPATPSNNYHNSDYTMFIVCFCLGGHATDPKVQKTQQSPSAGRSVAPQPTQIYKSKQESTGMVSLCLCPQFGQVRTERNLIILPVSRKPDRSIQIA